MIDRVARDRLAEDLRHLVAGQITNDQFENRRAPSSDAAVREIQLAAWKLYDDLREHKLTGRDAPSPDDKHLTAKCMLFLKTDLEYEWPEEAGLSGCLIAPLSLITFGLVGKAWETSRDEASGGDRDAWPFFRKSDYDDALRHPPYLGGTGS
jgi:hypothetical protein